jgi:hypothetical protein
MKIDDMISICLIWLATVAALKLEPNCELPPQKKPPCWQQQSFFASAS